MTVFGRKKFVLVLILWAGVSSANANRSLHEQAEISRTRLLQNVSRLGAPGSVAASPQTSGPDYAWHWVRDAALVMDWMARRFVETSDPALARTLMEFAEFSRQNQTSPTLSGLGEPRFTLQGQPFQGPWGRPQDDGPALRALSLIRFARTLLRDSDPANDRFVTSVLYDGKFPSASVIKTDLEYVATRILESSFDVWEEVRGRHFYTGMVQRRALVEGAALARELFDFEAADWYDSRADVLTRELERFWDASRGWIQATRSQDGGLTGKQGLDASVLLASLHAGAQEAGPFLPPGHPWILATAERLSETCLNLYRLNWGSTDAVMIGRYPEDFYYGGNPWFLTTLAWVEVYTRAAKALPLSQSQRARLWRDRADRTLERLLTFTEETGAMAEQFDRDFGTPVSARDLSWSYVAFLNVVEARGGTRERGKIQK